MGGIKVRSQCATKWRVAAGLPRLHFRYVRMRRAGCGGGSTAEVVFAEACFKKRVGQLILCVWNTIDDKQRTSKVKQRGYKICLPGVKLKRRIDQCRTKAEGRSHIVTVLSEVEPVWSQEMRDNAGLKVAPFDASRPSLSPDGRVISSGDLDL